MPLNILRKVYDYCTYNKKFLAFILILIYITSLLGNYSRRHIDTSINVILQIITAIVLSGYGMCITKDRINDGKGLPKIIIKDVLLLGLKASIISIIYLLIQGLVLDFVCSPFNFPPFNLEDMLINLPETIEMLYSHNPVHTLIFITLGAILFFVTTFFMEIALARLADTGSLKSAFNFISIKRSIDSIGWIHYTIDYTLIIFTIVILTYINHMIDYIPFIDAFLSMFIGFLIFATEYMGIGAVYREMKIAKAKRYSE